MLFLKAEIGDRDRIQGYFSEFGENSCQHSFINMFTLYEKYGSQYCEQDGFLYIMRAHMREEGVRTYLFPMGGGNTKKAVENILEDAHSHHAKVRFSTVTDEKCKWLQQEFDGVFEVKEVRDYAEYLYLSSDLINLPGRKFAQKRSDVRKIRSAYEGRMEETLLTRDQVDEILAFDRKWIEDSRSTHDVQALWQEYRNAERQLAYFDELKISGIIVRIDGVIQGFGYGAPISGNCYDVIAEKGNREIDHIYRVLNQDLAKMCAAGYEYINREEDVGVPGLRQAKLSYGPEILLRKFIVEEIER